jgi:hypothetical protein
MHSPPTDMMELVAYSSLNPDAAVYVSPARTGPTPEGRCRAPPSRTWNFPLPALRPAPAPPGAAVGQLVVGWGPQGSLPDPAHLGPKT